MVVWGSGLQQGLTVNGHEGPGQGGQSALTLLWGDDCNSVNLLKIAEM